MSSGRSESPEPKKGPPHDPNATPTASSSPSTSKDKSEGIALVSRLKDARTFKVGLELFTAEGPALFRKLKALRKDIFLDLKLHDIPNTVAGAVRSAVRHGVQMMTIHTFGRAGDDGQGRRSGPDRRPRAAKDPKPILLGVTVLTSLKGRRPRRSRA